MHTPNDNLPKSVQSAFKHGIKREIIAKEKYVKAMNFKLFRNIVTEDTGLLIQPNLTWHQAPSFTRWKTFRSTQI